MNFLLRRCVCKAWCFVLWEYEIDGELGYMIVPNLAFTFEHSASQQAQQEIDSINKNSKAGLRYFKKQFVFLKLKYS